MRKTKAEKLIDTTIERAYYKVAQGVQISVLDIGKVFAVGRAALTAGKQGAELETAISDFVQTIRRN